MWCLVPLVNQQLHPSFCIAVLVFLHCHPSLSSYGCSTLYYLPLSSYSFLPTPSKKVTDTRPCHAGYASLTCSLTAICASCWSPMTVPSLFQCASMVVTKARSEHVCSDVVATMCVENVDTTHNVHPEQSPQPPRNAPKRLQYRVNFATYLARHCWKGTT